MNNKKLNLSKTYIVLTILGLLTTISLYIVCKDKYFISNLFQEEKLTLSEGEKNITLGQDLSGGVSAIYKPELPKDIKPKRLEEYMARAVEIIQKRLMRYGDLETDVRIDEENQIHVVIPGLQNPQRIVDILDETGTLEVYLLKNSNDEELAERSTGEMLNYLKGIVDSIGTDVEDHVVDQLLDSLNMIANPFTSKDLWQLIAGTDDIGNVKSSIDDKGHQAISFELKTQEARLRMYHVMKNYRGYRVAFVFSGDIKQVVQVQGSGEQSLISSSYQITAPEGFTEEEIEDYLILLESRPLPFNLTLVRSDYMYPIFGQIAREKLLLLILAAFILIGILISYYYGGGMTIMAMLLVGLTILFQLAIYASTNLVITLPGLTGFLLVIGMTIDAAVLIFEEMKEKVYGTSGNGGIKFENTPKEYYYHKLREVFGKKGGTNLFATISIIRLTNILGALAILWYTKREGPVAGFGWTLLYGSALVLLLCSKPVLRALYDFSCGIILPREVFYNLKFGREVFQEGGTFSHLFNLLLKKKRYVFTGMLIAAFLSVTFISIKGFNYGVDFTGGRTLIFSFNNEVSKKEIAEIANSELPGSRYTLRELLATSGSRFSIRTNSKVSDVELSKFTTELGHLAELKIESSAAIGAKMVEHEVWQAIKIALILLFVLWLTTALLFAIYGIGIVNPYNNDMYTTYPILYCVFAVLIDLSLLGGIITLFGIELSASILGVIFLLVGYSINDSFVFVAEMKARQIDYFVPNKADTKFENSAQYVDAILSKIISRILITSISTLLVVIPLFIMGGNAIKGYSTSIFIGILLGVLSSVFLVSTLLERYLKDKPRTLRHMPRIFTGSEWSERNSQLSDDWKI